MILRGQVTGRWHRAGGGVLELAQAPNLVCFAALDLIGLLLCGWTRGGVTYLAVGSGDPSWDAHPPAPDRSRTALTHEVYRIRLRPGAEVSHDAGAGAVDVRVTLGPGVATGALREVGLFGGDASAAPGSGLLVNHKAHDRIDKADGDTVDRELRLQLAEGLLPGARELIGGLLAGTPLLAGLQFAALGTDGTAAAEPPAGLLAEVFRARLGRSDVVYDRISHQVTATLTVPFSQGPDLVAEAGLFGGAATGVPGSGLLVQRQTFPPVDRSVPRPIVRRFSLSLVSATPVVVPAVVGSSQDVAVAALAATDLVVGRVHQADGAGAAAGTVLSQDPAAGASVMQGSPVTLSVAAEAMVAVPDVVGLPLATALAAITAVGLSAADPRMDEVDAPRGTVVAVQPPAGTRVVRGSAVTATVATPPVRAVPDVLGRTPPAAAVVLASAGFTLAPPPYRLLEGGSTAGTIVAQEPRARTNAAVDGPVTITLAAPWGVTVPDLAGMTLDAAAAALREAGAAVLTGLGRPADPPGLSLGSTSQRSARTGETVGAVVGQAPPAGSRAPLYAAVSVVVAGDARQPVPPLSGLALGAAAAALTTAGFALGAVGHRAADTAAGTVVDQDPDAGSTWPPGGRVAVTLAVPVTVVVPDVLGLDQGAAAEGLSSRGLVLGTVALTATGPGPHPGQVLGQDPAAGSTADKGSTVALSVAQGMPNLVGRSQADAVATVTALGLSPTVSQAPSEQPPGTVTGQDPAAGAATTAGQAVTIVVAVPMPVVVPDVTGLPFPAAQAKIADLGLVLTAGGTRQQGGVPEGTVLALDPAPGSTVPQGTTVAATLSTVPPVMVDVPSLGGRPAAEAKKACAAVGLVLTVSGSRPAPGTQAETVIAQDPPAGTSVQVGSAVSVVIASVDTSVLVPDLRSMNVEAARSVAEKVGLGLASSGTALSLGPSDVVLSQDPLPNSRVPSGATVGVVLSVAAVRLPDVRGLDIADATAELRDLGLAVRDAPRRVVGGDGTVFAQSPTAGTVVAVGSTVTLGYTVEAKPTGPLGGLGQIPVERIPAPGDPGPVLRQPSPIELLPQRLDPLRFVAPPPP